MFLPLLFGVTLVLLAGFLGVMLFMTKGQDDGEGYSGLSKAQIRALGWALAIVVCLIASAVEYFVVVRGSVDQ